MTFEEELRAGVYTDGRCIFCGDVQSIEDILTNGPREDCCEKAAAYAAAQRQVANEH
jgi:hypothetical protein